MSAPASRRLDPERAEPIELEDLLAVGLVRSGAAPDLVVLHPLIRSLAADTHVSFRDWFASESLLRRLADHAASRLDSLERAYSDDPSRRGAAITGFEQAWPWVASVSAHLARKRIVVERLSQAAHALSALLLPPRENIARLTAAIEQTRESASFRPLCSLALAHAEIGDAQNALRVGSIAIDLAHSHSSAGIRALTRLAWAWRLCESPIEARRGVWGLIQEFFPLDSKDRVIAGRGAAALAFISGLFDEHEAKARSARDHFSEALRLNDTIHDVPIEAAIRLGLARTSIALDEPAIAAAEFAAALEYAAQWHDRRGVAYAQRGLAQTRALQGAHAEARALANEYLDYLKQINHLRLADETAEIEAWFRPPPRSAPAGAAPRANPPPTRKARQPKITKK